ncbi:MAG: PAS domain S-box protein [Halobacteriota archaeon]|nr:PAS domain S-box protein [Halobacteriota archaeon]
MSETTTITGDCILIVEDDEKLSHLIKKNLVRIGYQTETARDGAEAIEKVNSSHLNLLLLDYGLPDMTGKEVVEELIETGHTVPFVIMTGQGGEKIAVEMMKLGARDYIIKDTGFVEFLPRVVGRVAEQIKTEMQLAKTEARLHESQRSISNLMKHLPGMAYRSLNDEDRTILFASEGSIRLTGYQLSDLGGISYLQFIHEEDREMVLYEINSAVEERRPYEIIYRINATSGEVKWVWEKGSGVYSSEGELEALEGFVSDISRRKWSEEALQRSEDKYRNLIERANDGIVIVQDNVFKFINRRMAQMFGYDEEEMIGTDFSRYISPDFKEIDMEDYEDGKGKEGIVNYYETQAIRKDGKILTINVNVGPIKYEGMPADFIFIRDITRRKKAEEELERASREITEKNRELEQIVYATSHDLRSPLVNVQGFSKELGYSMEELKSILQEVEIPQEAQKRFSFIFEEDIPEIMEFIQTSILKMDSLLSGLLRLSRLGRAALKFENLDMDKVVYDIEKSIEFRIKEADVSIKKSKLPPCIGDAVQINQVFSNLVDNALKYRDPEKRGIINITGERKEGEVIYCIEDNGIGIAEQHLKSIFEIFHRLDPKATEGEGLGLSLVSKILSRHNGKIWVESEEGVGSKFYVSLPGAINKDDGGENHE